MYVRRKCKVATREHLLQMHQQKWKKREERRTLF